VNASPVTQPQTETDKLHFLDYWQVITKRKEVIIATAVILIFAATVYSFVKQSQYTATSQVRIETSSTSMHPFLPGPEEVYLRPTLDEAQFNTHQREIVSSPVLRKVVEGDVTRTVWRCDQCGTEYSEDDIRTMQDVKCTREGCDGHIGRYSEPKYPEWVNLRDKWTKDDDAPEHYTMEQAVARLRAGIVVRAERGTRLINISYTSPDKTEVASIADMIAEVYRQYQDEETKARVNEALSVLNEEIDRLLRGSGPNKGLLQLEDELNKFKHDNRIVIGAGGLIEHMDLNQFRATRLQREVEVAGLRERLTRLEGLPRDLRIASLQGDQALYSFRQLLAQQKITLNQALVEYAENHDQVIRLKESIAELEKNIDNQVEGILNSMRFELESKQTEKTELDTRIQEIENEIFRKEDLLSEYRRLSNEVERRRAIYSQVSQKKTMEYINQSIPSSRVVVAQHASPPTAPSKPNRMFNIIIGVALGLFVGTGLAYFIEYLDTSVKTIDDLERNLNMPILGVIPQRVKLLTEATHKSPAYEAYRMLWTNIEFARQDSKLRTLLVTSGGVGEGKTTSLVNLAIVAAREGNRVLVVDSDFRRPRVHKLLGTSNQTGLTDVLLRRIDPERAAVQTDVPGLWVLPSGKLPPSAMGLLNSRTMRECIEYLYDKYDIVLFDSPPVIGVSDASVLASLVDRIILIVEYRKYPKSVATRAKKILENVGGRILGGVINNLNIIKEDYYYYSQVYHYFQSTGEKPEDEGAPPDQETPPDQGEAKPDDTNRTA
jgi:succinoglycan biosynthesis transport protein ExoP